jgi:hypothetical protein
MRVNQGQEFVIRGLYAFSEELRRAGAGLLHGGKTLLYVARHSQWVHAFAAGEAIPTIPCTGEQYLSLRESS